MNENEEMPKLEPVASGKVKKKNFFERFSDTMFEQKDTGTIRTYLFNDIIKPTFKRFTMDIVTEFLSQLLYGGPRPGNTNNTGPYVNYRYSSNVSRQAPVANNRSVSGLDIFDFGKIDYGSRKEAYDVLDQMYDLLSRYDLVRVSQFYDLSGCTTDNVQAQKFGWMDLSGADVVQTFGGRYYIRLPKPYPLD